MPPNQYVQGNSGNRALLEQAAQQDDNYKQLASITETVAGGYARHEKATDELAQKQVAAFDKMYKAQQTQRKVILDSQLGRLITERESDMAGMTPDQKNQLHA